MKGVAIASLAAVPLLISAAIVLRAAPPAAEQDGDFPPIAAAVETGNIEPRQDHDPPSDPTSRLRLSERPRLQSSMRRESAATNKPAAALNPPANDPPDISFLEQEQDEEVSTDEPPDAPIDPALQLTLDQTATLSTSRRNADFPRTYISSIHVDLTSPNHWVSLTWSGPDADAQETGPFHSSPGRGLGNNDCDDVDESNRDGSNCTPKGTMQVQGFSDSMPMYSHCRFVTWFQIGRGIAFHYYPQVPNYPASHGCVRLNAHAAQLIHNNSKIGATEVIVDGKWEFVR